MAAFLKLFITILAISILLRVLIPDSSTALIQDDLFNQFLEEGTDPLTNETTYTGFNNQTAPQWSESGQQESGFFQKFIDGLTVTKRVINTIINISAVPIKLAISLQIPIIVRMMFFIPLALIYIICGILTIIRGVNP